VVYKLPIFDYFMDNKKYLEQIRFGDNEEHNLFVLNKDQLDKIQFEKSKVYNKEDYLNTKEN